VVVQQELLYLRLVVLAAVHQHQVVLADSGESLTILIVDLVRPLLAAKVRVLQVLPHEHRQMREVEFLTAVQPQSVTQPNVVQLQGKEPRRVLRHKD
jgi:hypothetical protein